MRSTVFTVLAAAAVVQAKFETDSSRPNWVILLADDFGWGSPGYNQPAGQQRAKTVNLDAMSTSPSTMRFDKFYSGGPVCSPTRASIFTGRTPNRDCVWTAYVNSLNVRNKDTISQVASRAGYRVMQAGKWHLGNLRPGDGACHDQMDYSKPGDFDIDTWYSTLGSGPSATYNCYCAYPAGSPQCAPGAEAFGECEYNSCHLNYFLQPAGQGSPTGPVENETRVLDISIDGGSDAQLIVDQFESFLKTINEQADPAPFVAVLTFHSPHLPHNAAPEFVKMYNDTQDPLHTDYYGTITDVDQQVGRVRSLLAANGVADNTAVVFTSDNGQERHQPGNEATEGRISGCKRWLKLGGVNVPGLIEWPGVINGNTRTNVPAVTMDLLPTFLDSVSGASRVEPSWPLDGASLMPLLRGTGPVVRPSDGIGHATILAKAPGDEVKDCLPVGSNHAEDGAVIDPDVEAFEQATVQLGNSTSYPDQTQISWTGVDGLRLWGTGKFPITSASALQGCAKAILESSDPGPTRVEDLTRRILNATDPVFKLYNITEDEMEANDISDKLPTAKADMAAKLLNWLASTLNSTATETECVV